MTEIQRYVTVGEAAKILGVANQTVRNRIERGELRAEREIVDTKTGRWEYRLPFDQFDLDQRQDAPGGRRATNGDSAELERQHHAGPAQAYPERFRGMSLPPAIKLDPKFEELIVRQAETNANALDALQEHLRAERERSKRLEEHNRELERKLNDRLNDQLDQQKGWFRRFFGF